MVSSTHRTTLSNAIYVIVDIIDCVHVSIYTYQYHTTLYLYTPVTQITINKIHNVYNMNLHGIYVFHYVNPDLLHSGIPQIRHVHIF